ncbi:hypothetical protein FN846DRAFT_60739 [Sphaerosporella brunnea]|uniref:GmrSD restriction endonucleases C-terminal domain-containing protein n=1 Tax=Sphaerosporella brunnea TaxID=1250544 RepID=A0A5J5F9K2_9PEZI|nr:hypothetical protein FN846DRAFT_60739 [Sphaerosporella brunnea]
MNFSPLALFLFGLVASVSAAPPNIPDTSSAKIMLSDLSIRTTDATGYERSKFPHWITINGCSTRETVLKRDGTGLKLGAGCSTSAGTWYSAYDGATWTSPSDLEIDHVVPLFDAWKSGANAWTTDERRNFANDLTNPQLIAITSRVNTSKGGKSPDDWKPPLTSYYCTYAKMWVQVKSVYSLSVTSDEKNALDDMLKTCV